MNCEIVTGYRPGAIGRIVALHGEYYVRERGLDERFEAEVATELGAFARQLDPLREGLWLALADGEIVGSIAAQAELDTARLRWFIVAPALRGSGAGRVLLARALQQCRDRRYRRVFLWTFAGLDAARHLYEQAGFRLMEEVADEIWGPRVTHQRFDLDLAS